MAGPGGAATHTITSSPNPVTLTASYTTQYYLTTSASPASEGSISPASEWVNAGMVVAVSASPAGNNVFAGFSGPLSGTTSPQNLTVNAPATVTANFSPAPDFTITVTPTANPSVAMAGGNGASYTISAAPNASYTAYHASDAITLTPNLPSNFGAAFGSNGSTLSASNDWQTTVTITAPAGSAGNISAGFTATDTSISISHNATGGTLTVQDFMLVISPGWSSTVSGLALAVNQSGYWTLAAQGLNGFNQPITLTETTYVLNPVQGVPTGCNGFLGFSANPQSQQNNPGSMQPGQTVDVNITAGSSPPSGTPACGVAISASYGGTTHFVTGILLYTNTTDFTLLPPPPQTVGAGTSAMFNLLYQPVTPSTWTMGISVAGLPQGATYSTTPFPNGGYGSTLTANVPAGVAPGTYQLTVTASGVSPAGCISGCANATHSEIVILTVSGGQGFTISATPTSSQPVAQGGSAAFNVSVGSVNNYNGSVQLTASGGPPGSVITLNGITGAAGAPVTATLGVASSTSMSVATPAGAGPGTYSISLSAVANGVSKTASTSVTIAAAPAPASIVSPMPGSIPAGTATFTWNAGTGATEYTFAISGANGYSYPATTTTAQSITVPSIPASASPLTVTLQSLTGGIWGSQTYLYSIPSTTVTLSLGTVTVRKNGQAATINSPLTGNDTITGCSAVPGGTTSVSQTGWSPSQQAISLTAGPTSQIGPNPFSCTSQQGWTMDGVLGIDDDPDFTITSATQDPGSGAWNLTLTANYQDGFGDMPGLVQIPGAQVSVTWGGDQIMVVAQVTSCNSYDVKVILAEPGEFSILEGDGPPEADESIDMCPLTPPPPASYTISGVVTAPNGKPLAGVTVTVSGSSVPGTGEVQSSATDSTGRYSIGVTPVGPSCGTAQVSASFASPYTIPFTPYDSNGNAISGYFPCAQNDITVNFISSQFTTVFLLHGIGQGASAMSTLARSLVSPVAGINTSQFYVDAGFDFSECATKPGCTNANATPTLLQASEGVLACSVSIGGKKLADYILNVSGHDSGSIILLGYSMGGLIARDLLSNGKTSPYQYVIGNSTQTNNTIVGLITLSTPNWGYAYVKGADDRLFCPQLVKDMAGAWNTTNASAPIPNQPLPSSFLPNLNGAWTPASYGGYWLAAGGRYCSNQSRENPLFPTVQGQPPTLPTGCYEPNGIYSNDGVVCADSAEYSSNPSGNPTAIFDDPQHRYSHTAFGTPFVMGCQPQSSAPTPTLVINQPPPTDTLFTQIVGVIINGH